MIADTRYEPPAAADERATLTGFLQRQRDTLARKCAGLTPAQLRTRAVEPSALSLLGLVQHLTEVERSWFRAVVSGEEYARHNGHADLLRERLDGSTGE